MHLLQLLTLLSLLSGAIACKGDGTQPPVEANAKTHAKDHSLFPSEPIGKAYLRYEASSEVDPRYIGTSDGIFVWKEWHPDRSFELFAVTLDEKWDPVSLGTHKGGDEVLVGPYLVRIDEDDAVWTAKLPGGPLVKSDLTIAKRNLSDAVGDQSHMVMFVDSILKDSARIVEMSTDSGKFTVSPIPPLPGKYAGAIAKAVDGDTVLVQSMAPNDSGDLVALSNFYLWLDLSTGLYSEYGPEWDANGRGIAIKQIRGGILVNKELYQGGKKVAGGQALAKASWDNRCRLRQRKADGEPGKRFIGCTDATSDVAEAIAEPVGGTGDHMSIESDSKWVVWRESWGPKGTKTGFFAAARR